MTKRRRIPDSWYGNVKYSKDGRYKYYYNYADTYEARKRREDFEKFIAAIGIAILALLACFFKKVHSRKLWKEFAISTSVLLATGFLCYAIATKTSPDVFTWGAIVSFIVYCIYWCII